MAKAVFTYKPDSRYDDDPALRYQFPKTYLNVAERAVGDLIVYYEPRRTDGERAGGRQAYFAVARVRSIERDARAPDMFVAMMDDYLPFAAAPAFQTDGVYFESILRREDGKTNKGAFGRAMRTIPDEEFGAILSAGFAGLRDDLGEGDWAGAETYVPPADGFHDPAAPFERPIVERISARPFRDAAFARQVKAVYDNTCAMTGLNILNGGGRPEVQAAHIRAVKDDGPDSVRNGLALCGTAHWMFDRGLIAIDDDYSILVDESRVPAAARGLIRPERKLLLPKDRRAAPHPVYLTHHRENCFKG